MLSESAIEKLHKFNETGVFKGGRTKATGTYCYVLVMEQDGEEKFFPRFNQPCYGEMRIYRKGGWKPGDLHHPFPDGKPLGVAVRTTAYGNTATPSWDHTFSKDSLWGPLFENRFLSSKSSDENQRFSGFIMTDMDFNSDYWFSLLLSLRQCLTNERRWLSLVDKGVDPHTAWITMMLTMSYANKWTLTSSYSYSLQTPYSIKNLLNRTPKDFHDGKFFSDRATFRDTPDIFTSRIWGGEDNLFLLEKKQQVSLEEICEKYVPYIESFK